jgi:mRNA interferase YafQ
MLTPKYTVRFKKDIKKIKGSGRKDLKKLKDVMRMLIEEKPLEARYSDHPLMGNMKGHRDCHIEPDWLLIYMIDKDNKSIVFTRTGSHSELFG